MASSVIVSLGLFKPEKKMLPTPPSIAMRQSPQPCTSYELLHSSAASNQAAACSHWWPLWVASRKASAMNSWPWPWSRKSSASARSCRGTTKKAYNLTRKVKEETWYIHSVQNAKHKSGLSASLGHIATCNHWHIHPKSNTSQTRANQPKQLLHPLPPNKKSDPITLAAFTNFKRSWL